MIGVLLASVLAGDALAKGAPKPWELDYYRIHVRSAAQCVYVDGSRAALFRTDDPHLAGFLFRPSDRSSEIMIDVALEADDQFSYEANGGVTTYHMIDLALANLLRLPSAPLAGRNLDAFLSAAHPPACARKTFEADLYEVE